MPSKRWLVLFAVVVVPLASCVAALAQVSDLGTAIEAGCGYLGAYTQPKIERVQRLGLRRLEDEGLQALLAVGGGS